MKVQDFISSGIIEIYCMGIASEEEKVLVEKFAAESKEVKDEIAAVNEALNLYAATLGKSPRDGIRNNIMQAIAVAEELPHQIAFPPRMTLQTSANEWLKYMADNKLSQPAPEDEIQILDLPGDEKLVTYIAWAKKGSVVEESHTSEDEYLLMLKGTCIITVNGVTTEYKAGDIIFIPRNTVHRAEVTSDETMILAGQRIAA